MQGKMPELKRQDIQGKKLGKPFKMSREDFRARIRDVAFQKRKTLRSLAHATGMITCREESYADVKAPSSPFSRKRTDAIVSTGPNLLTSLTASFVM
jgi:hypothetical protein